MKKISIIAFALLCALTAVQAAKSYSCDFENQADRNRWKLNNCLNASVESKLKNKWFIGAPGQNGATGHNGLFISDDNGLNAHYTASGNFLVAFDTVTLDHLSTAGDYQFIFDYRSMGNVASNSDGLYVLWVPLSKITSSFGVGCVANGTFPNAYLDYALPLQPEYSLDFVSPTSTWKQCVTKIPNSKCDGQPHLLVFAWLNGTNSAQQPGACVDNIEITDDRPCEAPDSLKATVNGLSVELTWTGNASEYEVTCYSYMDNRWYGPTIVNTNFYSISGVTAGQMDFTVRAKCADDLYSLKKTHTQLVYFPDLLCVDYLNLTNAKCYINNSDPKSTITFNDFRQVPAVDYGPQNIGSRHTVHFDHNEFEPRTGNQLRTVPEGELASVRLGNWDNGNQAERIEFSFKVDTINYPVLLLKYAPILEAPGHNDDENPRFKLDILVGGQSIGECGQADFNCNDVYQGGALRPGAEKQGWHLTPREISGLSEGVVWKDWTTVGVNLRNKNYQGKTLTARLTTHDCTFSAHSGYAYFTLGCSDGKLKDMKCGEINPNFYAPDGFNYRWIYAYDEKYRRADGSIDEKYVLSRSQEFEAGWHTDSLFAVDCIFVGDSDCFFTLYASTLATNPIPVIKKPVVEKNCTKDVYNVFLDATESFVQEIDHLTGDTLVSINKLDRLEWDFGDGTGKSYRDTITHKFPSKGGRFDITLVAYYGSCADTAHYVLELDSLGPTKEVRTYYLCDKDLRNKGYHWTENDQYYKTYGIVDSVIYTNPVTTCDSIIYLELLEPARDTIYVRIMDDEVYHFHGMEISEAGFYDYATQDCDTTHYLRLTVYEKLVVEIPEPDVLGCQGDDAFDVFFEVVKGTCDSIEVLLTGSEKSTSCNKYTRPFDKDVPLNNSFVEIEIDTLLKPDVYCGQLTFVDTISGNVVIPVSFTLRYNTSVLVQRWNDVLAVRNREYNGGYNTPAGYHKGFDFIGYQWFKHQDAEQPYDSILGQNLAYLYQTLDTNILYAVELIDADSMKLMTCDYAPVHYAQGENEKPDVPTLVKKGENIPVQNAKPSRVRWINPVGTVTRSEQITERASITAPETQGIYLLNIIEDESGVKSTFHIIVQ